MYKYIKYLILSVSLIVGVFVSTEIKASVVDCNVHKLFCKIMKFNPNIDNDYAMKLSNIIFKQSKIFNIDPSISLAILMQESSLRNINKFKIEKTVEKKCGLACVKIIKEVHIPVDMTIAQININTAKFYNLDIERLFFLDLEYAIKSHMIILRDKMNSCKSLGDESWSCYHSFTEKYRKIYVEKVSRYL